jgi:hypothetical protein
MDGLIGKVYAQFETDWSVFLRSRNLKYEFEEYKKSREYSELKLAGSTNKKVDLSS